MAFNALYGGEPDPRERSRVMACIRHNFNETRAIRLLRSVTQAIDRILQVPPANLLLNVNDPQFRAASQRCAGIYRNRDETAVNRLAAIGGVLYQVRCNLIHGGKRPDDSRDTMLVRESIAVLQVLIPAIEEGFTSKKHLALRR
jgi:hypothetical protein